MMARRVDAAEIGRLVRFAIVGGISTLLYATYAFAFERWAGPMAASLVAYLLSGVFSYIAQRRMTFASDRPHRACVPRFILLNLVGLSLAVLGPAVLTVALGLHSAVAIGLTCVVAPAVSYAVMRRLVFGADGRDRAYSSPPIDCRTT